MKRFLKTFVLLILSLFVLVSGVDATLDHLSHSVTQSSYTVYGKKGEILVAYSGDLSLCQSYAKPGTITALTFQRRS